MGSRLARTTAATAAVVGWLIAAGGAAAQTPPLSAAPSAVAAPTAAAPAVTAEGAQALAKALAEEIAVFSPQTPGKSAIYLSGPPVVMAAGDHYVAALPSVSLRGEEQERLDVGSVWLTLKPLADGAYAVTIKLPASLVYMEDGDPAAVMTLGEQKISGVWSPALASFLSLEATLSDLQVTSVYDDYWFGVGQISFTQDFKRENAPGDGWSGPSALALSEVRLDKGEETLLSIGGVTAETVYSRFRLEKTAELLKTVRDAANGGKEPTPAAVFALLKGVMGGASSRLRFTDFAAHDPDDKQAGAFDLLTFSAGAADFDRPLASMDVGFEVKGLSFDPPPADQSALPTAGDFKLSLRNLPVAELLKLGEAAASNAPIPGGDPLAAALQIVDAAKLTLKLESLGAETTAMRAQATGEATARKGATFGAVAKAKLTLGGVDKLLADLKPKKGAKPDPANADLLGGLTMLKAMGRPEKDKNGAPVLAYTFELTPQGTVLVNDADLAPLLEGGK